jgi:hypothetical protein
MTNNTKSTLNGFAPSAFRTTLVNGHVIDIVQEKKGDEYSIQSEDERNIANAKGEWVNRREHSLSYPLDEAVAIVSEMGKQVENSLACMQRGGDASLIEEIYAPGNVTTDGNDDVYSYIERYPELWAVLAKFPSHFAPSVPTLKLGFLGNAGSRRPAHLIVSFRPNNNEERSISEELQQIVSDAGLNELLFVYLE